jgi:predicted PurR-regulated permease PerM
VKLDLKAIVQAVIVSLLLALVTGAFKTYMAVHDLQRDVQSLTDSVNDLWLQSNTQIQALNEKGERLPSPSPAASAQQRVPAHRSFAKSPGGLYSSTSFLGRDCPVSVPLHCDR